MFKTKNDLPEAKRVKLCQLLNDRLADSIDLQLQTKQAHWNVKGPHFIQYHLLFDSVYAVVSEAVDNIAERIVQLGGRAEGIVQSVAKRTNIPTYPTEISDGLAHIDALSTAIATVGEGARQAIDTSDELGDKDTADVFTGISRELDKQLWFVEAHLQGGA